MLIELYLLQTYFEEPAAIMFEDDLVHHFGAAAVRAALDDGLLESRRIPCGRNDSRVRRACRLSPAGRALACASIGDIKRMDQYRGA